MDGTAREAERRLQGLTGRNVRVSKHALLGTGVPPVVPVPPRGTRGRTPRLPTCQGSEGEMLRLAALPFAVNDAEVDFDRLAHGRVSVGRNLHKQHILQSSEV